MLYNACMTQLQRYIESHRGSEHVKKLLRRYRERMKKRTVAECLSRWERYGRPMAQTLRELADIHELPNACIYPTDRALLFFINPYTDLREVETLRLFDELASRDIQPEEIVSALDTRLRYMWQLFHFVSKE